MMFSWAMMPRSDAASEAKNEMRLVVDCLEQTATALGIQFSTEGSAFAVPDLISVSLDSQSPTPNHIGCDGEGAGEFSVDYYGGEAEKYFVLLLSLERFSRQHLVSLVFHCGDKDFNGLEFPQWKAIKTYAHSIGLNTDAVRLEAERAGLVKPAPDMSQLEAESNYF